MTDPDSSSSPGDAEVRLPLSGRRILKTWWPLAASWILMGLEGPAISAVVARLADPTVNLAAFGGVVFPLALIVEAPIIMMLAASTALCRDWASYLKLRRFMNRMGAVLTVLHILMVATPFYYVLVRGLIHAPEEIVEPARLGLFIMIPWTWSIAHRRFEQGVLIRFGQSLKVGFGTGVRLSADAVVLTIGYFVGGLPGIAVAAGALAAGVLSEALYVHLAVQKTLRYKLRPAPPVAKPLSTRAMLDFYIPLSLTQLLVILATPIGSAAMSRMPLALESLAAWPIVGGINFIVRGFGGAYNEVVVALVEEERAMRALRRFAFALCLAGTVALLLLMIPAVSDLLFRRLLHLAYPLPRMAWISLFALLPGPTLAVMQSYFQGVILFSRRTRSITESVGMYLTLATLILLGGVIWGEATGLYVALLAFLAGDLLRVFWLRLRSRDVRYDLHGLGTGPL